MGAARAGLCIPPPHRLISTLQPPLTRAPGASTRPRGQAWGSARPIRSAVDGNWRLSIGFVGALGLCLLNPDANPASTRARSTSSFPCRRADSGAACGSKPSRSAWRTRFEPEFASELRPWLRRSAPASLLGQERRLQRLSWCRERFRLGAGGEERQDERHSGASARCPKGVCPTHPMASQRHWLMVAGPSIARRDMEGRAGSSHRPRGGLKGWRSCGTAPH